MAGAPGTDGNSQRNAFYGPGSKIVELGIFRDFKLRERFTLQARGEFTNAFNLVNLNNPDNTIGSGIFGQILSAHDMRQTQVGLKLTF